MLQIIVECQDPEKISEMKEEHKKGSLTISYIYFGNGKVKGHKLKIIDFKEVSDANTAKRLQKKL